MCQERQITVEVRVGSEVPIKGDLREMMLRHLFSEKELKAYPSEDIDEIEVSVTLGPVTKTETIAPAEKIMAKRRSSLSEIRRAG